MKVTYDSEADAVYFQLAEIIADGSVHFTYTCDPTLIHGMINLDFDAAGCLIGIEVMDASHKIPAELLRNAVR